MPTAQAARADICAIIVSHNSRGWLDAALRSLARHTHEVSLEAIVVDNGTDRAGEWAESHYPFVRAVRCENHGFGHANNRGLELADARFVLFLNPATDAVRVSGAELAAGASVELLDATGRVVRRLPTSAAEVSLPLAGLAPGVYAVRCGTATRRLVVK